MALVHDIDVRCSNLQAKYSRFIRIDHPVEKIEILLLFFFDHFSYDVAMKLFNRTAEIKAFMSYDVCSASNKHC